MLIFRPSTMSIPTLPPVVRTALPQLILPGVVSGSSYVTPVSLVQAIMRGRLYEWRAVCDAWREAGGLLADETLAFEQGSCEVILTSSNWSIKLDHGWLSIDGFACIGCSDNSPADHHCLQDDAGMRCVCEPCGEWLAGLPGLIDSAPWRPLVLV